MKIAAEFWLDNYFSDSISDEDKKLWLECNNQAQITVSIMIEFAKMHVQAALKEAFENAETDYTYEGEGGAFKDIPIYNYFVKKDSILNSYPESNIK